MKSIAFVTTMNGAQWGGSEELWSRAALRLRQAGYNISVHIHQWRSGASQLEELRAAGCRIFTHRSMDKLNAIVGSGFADRMSRRQLQAVNPDFVVVSLGYQIEGSSWTSACRTLGIPYSLLVQSVGETYWPDDITADLLGRGYVGARRCFFVSRANQDLVERQLGVLLPDAQVVRNPFNVSPDADPPWPDTDNFRLACVGRLHCMSKGQDILLAVLRDPKWKSRRLRVTLIGEGPNYHTLMRLKELYGLDNVEFRGHVADVEGIWAEHHALVLASRFEGLPLVLVEAMMCGRIGIVTDVAGNTELLEDGKTGFVAAGPSPLQLDLALERAWERRSEWREMGQAARNFIRPRYVDDPVADFADRIDGLAAGV